MPRADELPIGSARLEAARLDGHSADTEQISSSPGEDDHVVAAVGPNVGLGAALLTAPASVEHVGRVHSLLGPAASTAELLVNRDTGADSLAGPALDALALVRPACPTGADIAQAVRVARCGRDGLRVRLAP